ncbi:CLUMA_CG003021, isoform A [Clunio marinus]|uniref:CLUMA_CG003021, isoform A n=1 Tax=Clunio marinus TaxID=568069 RepID=A0A1J1HS06_9DIPT|nr:CLUMA_CG003021, isoform A [Clunio marinus]
MDVQVEHMLALKVMRLTRPGLTNFGNTIFSEKSDLLQFDPKNENVLPQNQLLQLPQAFGNIYLGETFSSYICVHNCTTHPVNSVSVKCDLQSNNSRVSIPIHANKTIPTSLNDGETLDDVIHYEVKEIGTHILVCEVNYISPAGLPLSFRKFFKFQVLKPLDVATKFYNSETDEVFLEATIQNITAGTICLERVELEASEQYTVTSLNQTADGKSIFSSIGRLQPQNSCQFLYCIKPIPSIASDLKVLKLANNIGKVDIVWRSSNFAERGRLQTSQLQRSPVEYGDLRLTVIEAESMCTIATPFVFKCRVTNTSNRSMELNLNFNMKSRRGHAYTGSSEQSLGMIEPERTKEFTLTIFPTRLGIISISDLQLTDVYMKRSYEFEDILQVFIVDDLNETYDMQKFVKYHDIPATSILQTT